jgi:hypothetical protein
MSLYLTLIAAAMLYISVETVAGLLRWTKRLDDSYVYPGRGMIRDLLPVYAVAFVWLGCIAGPAYFFSQFGCDVAGVGFAFAMATFAGMGAGLRQIKTPGMLVLAGISRKGQ